MDNENKQLAPSHVITVFINISCLLTLPECAAITIIVATLNDASVLPNHFVNCHRVSVSLDTARFVFNRNCYCDSHFYHWPIGIGIGSDYVSLLIAFDWSHNYSPLYSTLTSLINL